MPYQPLPAKAPITSDNTITYAASVTTDASTLGFSAILRMPMTGDITINAPTNGTGQTVAYYLTADGSPHTLMLGGTIKTPDGFTFVGTVAASSVRILVLENVAGTWVATRNLNYA